MLTQRFNNKTMLNMNELILNNNNLTTATVTVSRLPGVDRTGMIPETEAETHLHRCGLGLKVWCFSGIMSSDLHCVWASEWTAEGIISTMTAALNNTNSAFLHFFVFNFKSSLSPVEMKERLLEHSCILNTTLEHAWNVTFDSAKSAYSWIIST